MAQSNQIMFLDYSARASPGSYHSFHQLELMLHRHYGTLAPVSTQRPRTQRSSSVMPLIFASGIVRSTTTRASIRRAYCFSRRAVSSMTPLGAIGKAWLVGCSE